MANPLRWAFQLALGPRRRADEFFGDGVASPPAIGLAVKEQHEVEHPD